MDFLGFLKGIGHRVAQGLGILRHLVPEAQLEQGVALVQQAEDKFLDNTSRREWVVRELMAAHVPEAVARLIVELALKIVKQEAHKATEAVVHPA